MNRQILVPKEIFVGDAAELRILFDGEPGLQLLPYTAPAGDAADVSVQSVALEGNGGSYTLRISFVPWRNGLIQLPAQRVYPAGSTAGSGMSITPASVEVASIIEKTGYTELRPQQAPQLLPGTTWLLYALAFCAIALLALACTALFRMQKILSGYRQFRIRRQLKKNAARTLKQLRRLAKRTAYADTAFSSELQGIVRQYFEGRYGERFSSCTSSEFLPKYYAVTQGLLDDGTNDCAEAVHSALCRTDFVRYAPGARLNDGEREELLDTVSRCVTALETLTKPQE